MIAPPYLQHPDPCASGQAAEASKAATAMALGVTGERSDARSQDRWNVAGSAFGNPDH